MKTPSVFLLTLVCGGQVFAGIVTENTTPPANGVPYRWVVNLGGTDSASAARHVGAWSWEDDSLFPNPGDLPVGWTHTSDWVALSLTQAATFTLRLERNGNVPLPSALDPNRLAPITSMFPSISIWSGWDEDGSQLHTYNNRGNVAWAEDLTFVDFIDNSTQTFVERTWTLPAGQYSIVLGSNAPATNPDRQGYLATFSTAPIPEPGTLAFGLGLALVGLTGRKRKRFVEGRSRD
jgi:hypothetical protein